MSASQFTAVATVLVTVPDQDKALEFYVGTLGFEKRIDFPSPAGRWIEVTPAGSPPRSGKLPRHAANPQRVAPGFRYLGACG